MCYRLRLREERFKYKSLRKILYFFPGFCAFQTKLDWSATDPSSIVEVVFNSVVSHGNGLADNLYLIQPNPDAVEFGGLLLRFAVQRSAKVTYRICKTSRLRWTRFCRKLKVFQSCGRSLKVLTPFPLFQADELLICLQNDNALLRFDGSGRLSHGGYFFMTYRTSIIDVLLDHGRHAVDYILENLTERNVEDSFAVIIALLDHTEDRSRRSGLR